LQLFLLFVFSVFKFTSLILNFSPYNLWYCFSLYLNNQLINLIFLTIFLLFYSKKKLSKLALPPFYYSIYLNLYCILKNKPIEWPATLLLGLNTIHPYLYYISFLFLLLFIGQNWSNLSAVSIKKMAFVNSLALLLGMTWGSVNDLWGFFWVNDLIELVLFYLFLLYLYLLHFYGSKRYKILFSLIFSIILYIYMVRFSIISSRHSFFLDLQIVSYPLYLYFFASYFLLSCLYFYVCIVFQLVHLESWFFFLFFYLVIYNLCFNYLKPSLLFFHILFFLISFVWAFKIVHYNIYYLYKNNLYLSFLKNYGVFYETINSVLLKKSRFINSPFLNNTVHTSNYFFKKEVFSNYLWFVSYGYPFLNVYLYWFCWHRQKNQYR